MGNIYNFKGKEKPALEEILESEDFEEYSEKLKGAMAKLIAYTYELHITEEQREILNDLMADHGAAANEDGFSKGFNEASSLWIETAILLLDNCGKKDDSSSLKIINECLSKVMEKRMGEQI